MLRKRLLDLLENYQISFDEDRDILKKFLQFIVENRQCFDRSFEIGHITGSSWIVNRARTHVLCTLHKKLDKWLQLGGHADGDTDVFSVALREAGEESGLSQITPLSDQVFDIDIHPILSKGSTHYHYDVRFIFEADSSEALKVSHESKDVAWIPLDGIETFTTEPSILRMCEKTKIFFDL